ncbi:copper resistance CopC family protein [Amycolatopsis tucumanensis]|uniref:Copper resistance protein CopC n=1 Tax=Amycolatopsis tucumanensis TaxID=401106 RepID=A0ABP7JXN4_9PSEU|nr:copper resistance CopC family protein [Amycolatopsis tucumanensis]MCF6429130.1 copper resistance protein CopC [Amycolatopsis tucumanensis]
MKRILLALAASALAMLVAAPPALAHTGLLSSDPAEGDGLSTPPQQIRLNFNNSMNAEVSTVAITGPGGSQGQVGKLTVEGTALTAPVQATGPAGEYTLGYRVLSEDGHPVTGAVRFTLTAAALVAPASTGAPIPTVTSTATAASAVGTAAASSQQAGMPVWAGSFSRLCSLV